VLKEHISVGDLCFPGPSGATISGALCSRRAQGEYEEWTPYRPWARRSIEPAWLRRIGIGRQAACAAITPGRRPEMLPPPNNPLKIPFFGVVTAGGVVVTVVRAALGTW
jgi:hypothetical protein